MAGGKARKEKRYPPWYIGYKLPYHKNPKFSLEQHVLLNNCHAIDSIVEKSGIMGTDVVLEINPGVGNLTQKLLEAGGSVVAVEPNPLFAQDLELRFKDTPYSNRLRVIKGDIFSCELPYFDVCVANILNNSSQITFKLLTHRPLFRYAVIIVPQEFAMKLTAQPNDCFYCPLSVNVQLLASVSDLTTISKNSFSPPHRYCPSVIRLKQTDTSSSINFRDWYGLVGICFLKKSKTIGSVFKRKSVLKVLEERNNKRLREVSTDKELNISACISALDDAFGALKVESDDEDEEMEIENGDTKKRYEFKGKVIGVLKETGFEQKRCCQLTQADILQLLSLCNKAGIYFS